MKHIKLFEDFKWETIPAHIVNNVKNIVLEYCAKKLNVTVNDLPLNYQLGVDPIVRDIIIVLKDDLDPYKPKRKIYQNNHILNRATPEEYTKLRLTHQIDVAIESDKSGLTTEIVAKSLINDIDEAVNAIIKNVTDDMQIYWSPKLKKSRKIGVFDKE